MAERQPPSQQPSGEGPSYPTVLPPELAEFLKPHDYACVTQATDQGAAFVMKLPNSDIQSVRGTVPIHLRQELYAHPAAPVIRLVFTIYDQPEHPLAVETFINIADEQQRADFAALANQDALMLMFYDEELAHQLTKVVPYQSREDITQLLGTAEGLLQDIPEGERNFDAAKAAVIQATQV
jgi:hypothetical protein